MNKEEKFLNIISNTISDNSFLGDDCAYLKDYNLVVSQDTLVQDVHFRLNTISAFNLGKKALLVNISDILASGAKPEYLTVSLSGNFNERFIKDFYQGADEICKKYGLKIIGGDLTGGDKINISITIFGNTKNRNISSRKNAKKGYIVLLAGEAGSSAIGLSFLENLNPIPADICFSQREYFIKAHTEPKLCPKISEKLATSCKLPYAMMDTSDGLYDGLKKISESSNAGFNIKFNKIPKKTEDFNTVMFGGEDFGLLICIAQSDYELIKDDINIPVIGYVIKEKKILIDGTSLDKDLRYEHFE